MCQVKQCFWPYFDIPSDEPRLKRVSGFHMLYKKEKVLVKLLSANATKKGQTTGRNSP